MNLMFSFFGVGLEIFAEWGLNQMMFRFLFLFWVWLCFSCSSEGFR